MKLGPITLPLPNTRSRRSAVRYHDLHHVLAGYDTRPGGEGEISAFEIGGGCGREWFAWGINFQGMLLGLFTRPGATLGAFARGRHTRNLYGRALDDALLGRAVPDVRAELGLDAAPPKPSAGDIALFGAWLSASLALNVVLPLALIGQAIAACAR